jgi:hypothetical protein
MTLGVYSHVAKEDDIRVAAQLGKILDLSGPFLKRKGPVPGGQALVNWYFELVAGGCNAPKTPLSDTSVSIQTDPWGSGMKPTNGERSRKIPPQSVDQSATTPRGANQHSRAQTKSESFLSSATSRQVRMKYLGAPAAGSLDL